MLHVCASSGVSMFLFVWFAAQRRVFCILNVAVCVLLSERRLFLWTCATGLEGLAEAAKAFDWMALGVNGRLAQPVSQARKMGSFRTLAVAKVKKKRNFLATTKNLLKKKRTCN